MHYKPCASSDCFQCVDSMHATDNVVHRAVYAGSRTTRSRDSTAWYFINNTQQTCVNKSSTNTEMQDMKHKHTAQRTLVIGCPTNKRPIRPFPDDHDSPLCSKSVAPCFRIDVMCMIFVFSCSTVCCL